MINHSIFIILIIQLWLTRNRQRCGKTSPPSTPRRTTTTSSESPKPQLMHKSKKHIAISPSDSIPIRISKKVIHSPRRRQVSLQESIERVFCSHRCWEESALWSLRTRGGAIPSAAARVRAGGGLWVLTVRWPFPRLLRRNAHARTSTSGECLHVLPLRFSYQFGNNQNRGQGQGQAQAQQGGFNFYYIFIIFFVIYTLAPLFESKPNYSTLPSGDYRLKTKTSILNVEFYVNQKYF